MIKNTLTFCGVLSILLLSFTVVSAASLSVDNIVIPSSVNNNETSFQITFDLTNDGLEADINWSASELTEGTGEFSFSHNHINEDQTLGITATITIPTGQTGNIAGEIWADPSGGGSSKNVTFSVPITTPDNSIPANYNFCEINGKVGTLKISDITFTNLGEGDDIDWYLLDEIEIEVEIENTDKTNSIKNVLVEIKILDSDGNDATKDFEFDNEEIDLNTVKKDDSEIATFKIKELPADMESGDYKVYIKAYSDGNEEEQCVAEAATKYLDKTFYQSIDVTREDDPAVIIKQTIIPTISASCGDKSISVPASVYNLGSDKENKVLVTLTNSLLGLDEKIVIDNLKSGKRKEIEFFFNLPEELSKNFYTLDLKTYYDYDEDEDELNIQSYSESSFNDLDKNFPVRLEILSCKTPDPIINANLISEATLEKELVVEATITNNGDGNDFVISVANFESWADIISVVPQSATIDKGESEKILIKFMPTKEGSQSFIINAIVDGETFEKTVYVNISPKPSIFAGIDNTLLYVIIAIIVVLILIFLVLIIKVSRRQTKQQF